MAWPETTADGLPIAQEPPFVACVVVHRERAGQLEVLLLHRAASGPEYEGEWAWTPPAGSRFPGEDIDICAARELTEETSLTLAIARVGAVTEACIVYRAQAGGDSAVILDAEHDRFEWVGAEEAMRRCRPAIVAEEIRAALDAIAAMR